MVPATCQHAKTLIIIVGPTAVGKTAFAIEVANYFGTDVVSADSRQVYKGMAIGTAAPDASDLAQVPHHLVGFLDPTTTVNYSAANYAKDARHALDIVFQNNDYAVLTGGSGLYIKALVDGLDQLPNADTGLRATLHEAFLTNGLKPLVAKLRLLDPIIIDRIDNNNPRRVIRALEVCLQTGQPYSSFLGKDHQQLPYNIDFVGLNIDRSALYNRINLRVDAMIAAGLVAEVEALLPFRKQPPLQTVGYHEIFGYLDGEYSLATASDLIRQNTRRYAKRQLTWFNADTRYNWYNPNQLENYISKFNN